jgi:hypothetical protein
MMAWPDQAQLTSMGQRESSVTRRKVSRRSPADSAALRSIASGKGVPQAPMTTKSWGGRVATTGVGNGTRVTVGDEGDGRAAVAATVAVAGAGATVGSGVAAGLGVATGGGVKVGSGGRPQLATSPPAVSRDTMRHARRSAPARRARPRRADDGVGAWGVSLTGRAGQR